MSQLRLAGQDHFTASDESGKTPSVLDSPMQVATAFVLASDRFGEMHDLEVEHHGDDGLLAVCDDVIGPGTTVSLGFAHSGRMARRGEVVRCTPCGRGYRVEIRFLGQVAA